MRHLELKKTIISIALSTFWACGIMPSVAQTPMLVTLNTAVLVNIKAVGAPGWYRQNDRVGIGSPEHYGQGIIIDANGIIVTSKHIIGHAQHIYVLLSNGKIVEANLLSQSKADLCLLKISVPYTLRAIPLANPSELHVGSPVIAITNAGVDPQRVRGGKIIEVFKGTSSDAEVIEMNIPLKPGDSGGPILNPEGSLLGLIMGKRISDPSKSYAIALNLIQQEYFTYKHSSLN
jgi:S1-C subfamily serine protease